MSGMVNGEWLMLESLGSNFKEQSSKFKVGIAGGDGIVV